MRHVIAASLFLIASITVSAQTPLTGTKTIGGAGADYATIPEAAEAVNLYGVGTEGVTFDIWPGTYDGRVHLTPTSAGGSIVFRKALSSTGDVVVKATGSNFVWKIGGLQPTVMTLEGLKVVATDQDGIRFWPSAAAQLTIQNCEILLDSQKPDSMTVYRAFDSDSPQHTVTLRRNTILVTSSATACVGVRSQGKATLEGNRIEGKETHARRGVRLGYDDEILLVNNLLIGFQMTLDIHDGTAQAFHNTILGTSNTSWLVRVENGSLTFKNNLCSASGADGFHILTSGAITSDYNLYWLPNGKMGTYAGSTWPDLATWTSGTGQDSHSIVADPKLTSTDITAVPQVDSPCVNAGFPGMASTDIEGQSRPIGLGADIGAHELIHEAPIDLALPGSDPAAVTTPSPQFQARFVAPPVSSSIRCRIQVAGDPDFATMIWDSNPSWSDQSAPLGANMASVMGGQLSSAIPFGGSGLQWETTYYWRIRFWDDTYQIPTRWSEPASFTTSAPPATQENGETAQTSADSPEVEVPPIATPAQTSVTYGDPGEEVVSDLEMADIDSASAPDSGGGKCGMIGLDALLALLLLALLRRKF